MKTKLASRKDCDAIKGAPTLLFSTMKQHAFSHKSTQCLMKTTSDAAKSFIIPQQKGNEFALNCLKRSKATRDTFPLNAGKEFCFPKMVEEDEDCMQAFASGNNDNSTDDKN